MILKSKKLLAELLAVNIGLDYQEGVAQSNCFVFRKGEVLTYNNETACRAACSLPITGAINAKRMSDVLSKWPEEDIEFKKVKGKLQYKGKRKRGYFVTQDKLQLPIRDVEKPKQWKKLPGSFVTGVNLVHTCASRTSQSPHLSCIHFDPKWIEACDGTQAGRFELLTPFKKSVLLRKDAVKRAVDLDVVDVGEAPNWVHFRNEHGLTISCHKYPEKYPTDRLSAIFKTKGSPAILPKGLKGLTSRVSVFLDEDAENQWLDVSVTPTHICITGRGEHGAHSERRKIKYKGEPMGFSIHPHLLSNLADTHDKCEISKEVIKIKKGSFQYVTSLWIPNEKDED